MDNFNSFKPPVDASNGEPILPTEPENSSATEHDDSPIPEPEEILEQNEFVSEKIGPTSDENGYGTDARGHDIGSSDDLGPSYFEQYNEQRTDAAEKEHEKEMLKEEKEAFPDWYGEEASSQETADSIPSIEKGLDPKMVEALQNAISQKKESDEKFYNTLEDLASSLIKASESPLSEPQPSSVESDNPTSSTTTDTIDSKPLQSSATRNDMPASSTPITGANTGPTRDTTSYMGKDGILHNVNAGPRRDTSFVGKDGLLYATREEAINSFKD